MKYDVLIAGVGGQGTLFASRILSSYAIASGLNVLSTDTVGAAQRGGSVTSHIRISDNEIYSPLIPKNRASIMLGFEAIELLRHKQFASENTMYILNLHKVPTTYTMMGIDKYPSDEDILKAARRISNKGYVIKATKTAQRLGVIQSTNAVMIGALTKVEPFFSRDRVRKQVAVIAPRFAVANLKAFDAGCDLI
jgi:indolepyruvate ferredoxin oxidoreductase beta subunit